MSDHDTTLETILRSRLVGIVRLDQPERLAPAAQALAVGGFKAVEITLNSPGAIEAIAATKRNVAEDVVVGAGTVRSPEHVQQARDAGAQFIVSPDTNPDVIAATREAGLVSIPGALTPSEVAHAIRLGADIVKIFPASLFGPPYIKELLAPLDDARLMPTGGVKRDNVAKFLEAGATALAVGSSIVSPVTAAHEEWDTIIRASRAIVSAVEYLS